MTTYYELLGVSVSSSVDDINAARKDLARRYHPDRPGGDAKMMAAVNAAHSVLTDPATKKRYDAELRSKFRTECEKCKGTGCTYKQKGAKRVYFLCGHCHGVGRTV